MLVELLRSVFRLKINKLLYFIKDCHTLVMLYLGYIFTLYFFGFADILHKAVEYLQLMEIVANSVITGWIGLRLTIGLEMSIVVEQLLSQCLQSRYLLIETIKVLQKKVVAFEFSGIVFIYLLGQLHFFLLYSQMHFLE